MSKTPKADFAAVAAWLREHPTATRQDVATFSGWSFSSVSANWLDLKKAKRPPAVKGVPAKSMTDEDRETALGTVRDSYAILRLLVGHIRTQIETAVEKQRAVELDRDMTAAMLNLQKMAAGMIDAHPGLLELARKAGDGTEVSEDELRAVLDALAH